MIKIGWQIIRTPENSPEEFVMIYDLYIDKEEEEEENGVNVLQKSKSGSSGDQANLLNGNHNKNADAVFEE